MKNFEGHRSRIYFILGIRKEILRGIRVSQKHSVGFFSAGIEKADIFSDVDFFEKTKCLFLGSFKVFCIVLFSSALKNNKKGTAQVHAARNSQKIHRSL